MFKEKKRADVVACLEANGCRRIRDRGNHTVYSYPCGRHTAPLPRHRKIKAGVVNSIEKQLACLPKESLA